MLPILLIYYYTSKLLYYNDIHSLNSLYNNLYYYINKLTIIKKFNKLSNIINYIIYYYLYHGFLISIIGLIIETISDYQKYNFFLNKKNEDKFCNVGLWKYSRYPNCMFFFFYSTYFL